MKVFFLTILFVVFSGFYHREISGGSDTKPSEVSYASDKNFIRRFLPRKDETDVYVRGQKIETFPLINEFYETRQYESFWTTEYLPAPFADKMISFFSSVRNFGLEPSFYRLDELEELRSELILETERKQYRQMSYELEVMLSNSCFLFMSHLKNGVLKTDTLLNDHRFSSIHSGFAEMLEKQINRNNFRELLQLQPKRYEYVHLQKAIENYLRHNELQFDSITIPDPEIDSAGCYSITREILAAKGYLSDTLQDGDSLLIDALKKFQKAYGIQPDGIVGKDVREVLAMNSFDWYLVAAINLERLKWEKFSEANYVLINVPSFQLKIYENDSVKNVFKVIVGTHWGRTPDITSKIDQIITHPIWTVPRSIAVWEILPQIKRNPNYLKRKKYRFYDQFENEVDPNKINWDLITSGNFNYRIRQDRGGSNPLGMVKFNFKSPYSIYLHDTPEKDLFGNGIRSLSHGCIRLQYPLEFLNYLLRRENNPLKTDSINSCLNNNMGVKFNLDHPISIYTRYYTCLADSNGNLQFYFDIYQKDKELKRSFLKMNKLLVVEGTE